MKKHVLIMLLAVFTISCDSDDTETRTVNVDSTLIAKSNLYGNGSEGIVQQNLVINDLSSWNDLMLQMNAVNNVTNDFSERDIDFDLFTVIAVFDTVKNNGGHELDLSISSNSENILVSVVDLFPEGDDSNMVTQPFHIVKISRSQLPISFE
ncbi:hypothetical protein HNV08_08280 [Winogradskyella eckloniae]|uniref:hypothetical protein n=1 Tax=Winogradskyella eckloniae TaxID=1089306 RepID=UPI0015646EFB|nr:hypothetical protein [Winogradskyella eckloniae]NRD20043.1 hypothetical protein [Winogradskyella eckloniae]